VSRSSRPEEQAQAVHNDNHSTAFVAYNTDRKRDDTDQGQRDEDRDGAQGDDQILANDCAGALTETERSQEVFEAIVHEDDVRLFERRVRTTGAHGNSHVSGGKARRVIHTISDHGNSLALRGHRSYCGNLLFRLEFRAHILDAEFGLQVVGGGFAVARKNHGRDSFTFELGQDLPSLRSNIVTKHDPASQITGHQPYFRKPGVGRCRQVTKACRQGPGEPLASAKQTFAAFPACSQSLTSGRFELLDLDDSQALLFAITGDCAGEWVR
jgi:hypothetical protein